MPKSYILVGLTGSGKSTIGNCIWNKSSDLYFIRNTPFLTSDSSLGCTQNFASVQNEQIIILDTVGFGAACMDENTIMEQFKKALAQVNNCVDCVLFMVKKGRFSNEVVQFFETIQDKILMGKCRNNSILVLTGGEQKGWLNEQTHNSHVMKALANCNNRSYEFCLKFDMQCDDLDDKIKNKALRQKAINELLEFLNMQTFQRISLIHVQQVQHFSYVQELKSLEAQFAQVQLKNIKKEQEAKTFLEKMREDSSLKLKFFEHENKLKIKKTKKKAKKRIKQLKRRLKKDTLSSSSSSSSSSEFSLSDISSSDILSSFSSSSD